MGLLRNELACWVCRLPGDRHRCACGAVRPKDVPRNNIKVRRFAILAAVIPCLPLPAL